jgi:translocator protein
VGWSRPLAFWAVQLAFNIAWTPLFFGDGLRGLALVDLGALLVALAATIGSFWPVSRIAASLLLPYGAWVVFATALNASIWILNR